MEIKIGTKQVLLVLNVLSWIIFIGLCIEVGGILFNTVYAWYKPVVAQYFWNGADLSDLYARDKGEFTVLALLMFIAAFFKALLFYLIVRLFFEKKYSFDKPFHPGVKRLLFNVAYCCLGAGLFSYWGGRYVAWLETKGDPLPELDQLRIGGADVWLFMAVVLFVIGQVFRKGVELQTENDLTV
jgi:hypothetical protein